MEGTLRSSIIQGLRGPPHIPVLAITRPPKCHARPQAKVRSAPLPNRGNALQSPAVPVMQKRRAEGLASRVGRPGDMTTSSPGGLADPNNLNEGEAVTLRRLGWISYWVQLGLSLVSAGVLFFTVSSGMAGAELPIYLGLTFASVAISFVSTFLAYGYTRVARQVLEKAAGIKRAVVTGGILNSTRLSLLGLFLAILGLQATVGTLLGKVLTNASFNPLQGGPRGAPVAFDVYSIQASTNVILAHFMSIIFATWALNALNKTVVKKVTGYESAQAFKASGI